MSAARIVKEEEVRGTPIPPTKGARIHRGHADASRLSPGLCSSAGIENSNDSHRASTERTSPDCKNSFKFRGKDSQVLLLTGLDCKPWDSNALSAEAVRVHVDRPSQHWRYKHDQPLSPVLWRDASEYEYGESEEMIWRRIASTWRASRPAWHRFVPFWRLVDVEEVHVCYLRLCASDLRETSALTRNSSLSIPASMTATMSRSINSIVVLGWPKQRRRSAAWIARIRDVQAGSTQKAPSSM